MNPDSSVKAGTSDRNRRAWRGKMRGSRRTNGIIADFLNLSPSEACGQEWTPAADRAQAKRTVALWHERKNRVYRQQVQRDRTMTTIFNSS